MVTIKPEQPPGHVSTPGRNDRERPDRETSELEVYNGDHRLVQVGSHYHFFEVNPALEFDRIAAYGMRLDLLPGERIHFPPKESTTVQMTPIGGDKIVRSFYGVVNGSLSEQTPGEALRILQSRTDRPITGTRS